MGRMRDNRRWRLWLTLLPWMAGCASSVNTPSSATAQGSLIAEPDYPANMPPANTPQFISAGVAAYVHAQGAGLDQMSNPAYLAAATPYTAPGLVAIAGNPQISDAPFLHDPYRLNWSPARGERMDTSFINRYGAKLIVNFWSPKLPYKDRISGRVTQGPLPTLLLIPGAGYTTAILYEGLAQQLAENGYLVAAVNPQGQGGSDTDPSPRSVYCDPSGAWRQPQEAGVSETGDCAGYFGVQPPYTGRYALIYNLLLRGGLGLGSYFLEAHLEPSAFATDATSVHTGFRHVYVFAGFDATRWLLSDENPWRARVDADRLGIMGHSAGADAAYICGQADSLHRFKAIATWDDRAVPPATFTPSVPTMWQNSEFQIAIGPVTRPLPPDYLPARGVSKKLRSLGVPVVALALAGSNHQEWNYEPYAGLPNQNFSASSLGMQVAQYYTLAWFDRWLKGDTTSAPHGDEAQQIISARARLLARSFDDSADRTSIGQGTFDPETRANAPYKIKDKSVGDQLSIFQLSQISFDGKTCLDWQAGC